jgi:hypothetical protein
MHALGGGRSVVGGVTISGNRAVGVEDAPAGLVGRDSQTTAPRKSCGRIADGDLRLTGRIRRSHSSSGHEVGAASTTAIPVATPAAEPTAAASATVVIATDPVPGGASDAECAIQPWLAITVIAGVQAAGTSGSLSTWSGCRVRAVTADVAGLAGSATVNES